MGIRISMSIVFGVSGLTEPPDYDSDKPIELFTRSADISDDWLCNSYLSENKTDLYPTTEPKTLGDLVYWNNISIDDSAPNYIVGWCVSRDYNNDIFWALSAIDQKYKTPGFEVIPSYTFEESGTSAKLVLAAIETSKKSGNPIPFKNMLATWRKNPNLRRAYKLCKNGWYCKTGEYDTTLMAQAKTAKHVLKSIGLDVPDRELKMMLVWEWS